MAQFELNVYAYWTAEKFHSCAKEFKSMKSDMDGVADELDELDVSKESGKGVEEQQLAFLME